MWDSGFGCRFGFGWCVLWWPCDSICLLRVFVQLLPLDEGLEARLIHVEARIAPEVMP